MSSKLKEVYRFLRGVLSTVQNIIVVGAMGGDEGKGKVVHFLAQFYDQCVRFSGGENAGHTIYIKGKKWVARLLPSGLALRLKCMLTTGVYFNLQSFLKEIEEAKEIFSPERLPSILIDEGCAVWTPYHAFLEECIENCKGSERGNTTKKAISPLAGLYAFRLSPVVKDLFLSPFELAKKLKPLCDFMRPHYREAGIIAPTPREVADLLTKDAGKIKGRVKNTFEILYENWKRGIRSIFEAAQALLLDPLRGTYPKVSSGFCTAAGAAVGTGLPMEAFNSTIMVAKFFPTRVGAGPFPSELDDRESAERFPKYDRPELFVDGEARDIFLRETLAQLNAEGPNSVPGRLLARYIQVLGLELGAVSTRGRCVGATDFQWLRYASRVNNPKWLALTRFDLLSGLLWVPVVTGYSLDGKIVHPNYMPLARLDEVICVWDKWRGFEEDIRGCRLEEDLPAQAREVLRLYDQAVGVPILLVGTGPLLEDMVVRTSIFS